MPSQVSIISVCDAEDYDLFAELIRRDLCRAAAGIFSEYVSQVSQPLSVDSTGLGPHLKDVHSATLASWRAELSRMWNLAVFHAGTMQAVDDYGAIGAGLLVEAMKSIIEKEMSDPRNRDFYFEMIGDRKLSPTEDLSHEAMSWLLNDF